MSEHEATCGVAHGTTETEPPTRTLVAVFASPVARHLLRYAEDLGFRPVLVDPTATPTADGFTRAALTGMPPLDADTDVVVTDHHRPELGPLLRDALAGDPRWVGVMGNPRHQGPHVEALRELGLPPEQIARVHRPVGLNIGSRTPAEIAIATIAGLIADRNHRPGGFDFRAPA